MQLNSLLSAIPSTRSDVNGYSSNKLLAFTQRRIPYLPELKDVCGSVCASILMQQLEYWFAHCLEGFYKFLEPCRHAKYKPQDSWTEELHFTLREFRGAFDKIGIRYKSKKQLQALLELGEDPFQGRFYLSYVDVRSGLTLYHRNHDIVDAMLVSLLNDYCPPNTPNNMQPADSDRDDVLSFPDMTKAHIQRLQNVISGNDNMSSPYKEHKTTTVDDTKKTATIHNSSNKNAATISQPTSRFVAAVKNKKRKKGTEKNKLAVVENHLGDTLTTKQRHCVQRLLPNLSRHLPTTDAKTLEVGIAHTLCDPDAFTRAGRDFFKKLNTLQKAIRSGQWQVPIALQEQAEKNQQKHTHDLQQQYRELVGEHAQLSEMLTSLRQQGEHALSEKIETQRHLCQQRLDVLRQGLLNREESNT